MENPAVATLQAPLANQHSDLIDVFQFIDLVRAAHAANLRPFDIMLEAKANNLALLRLRDQITKFAPDLAQFIG
jgi:UV DNA damage endonuclease